MQFSCYIKLTIYFKTFYGLYNFICKLKTITDLLFVTTFCSNQRMIISCITIFTVTNIIILYVVRWINEILPLTPLPSLRSNLKLHIFLVFALSTLFIICPRLPFLSLLYMYSGNCVHTRLSWKINMCTTSLVVYVTVYCLFVCSLIKWSNTCSGVAIRLY